jgi:ubiquinone/menaquinone biosynthesis C-methylase UbiE
VTPFRTVSEEDVQEINRLQRKSFDQLHQCFEPPLAEGVPERLEEIVAQGRIARGDTVLDVGSGTGILMPMIKRYDPGSIYACDLSRRMLEQLRKNYPDVKTIMADVRDIELPDGSVHVAFINACYPNIADKKGAFANLGRMIKAGGRMVISHPLGKTFILSIKDGVPFPLDEFPDETEANSLFKPFGFEIETFIDQPVLYILVAKRSKFRDVVDEAE